MSRSLPEKTTKSKSFQVFMYLFFGGGVATEMSAFDWQNINRKEGSGGGINGKRKTTGVYTGNKIAFLSDTQQCT